MTKQTELRKRRELVRGAKLHIKSLITGMNKFKRGSNVESAYLREHFEKLKWYINKIVEEQRYD